MKYKICGDGYQDAETGAVIPAVDGNRHYQNVLDWIAAGNIPDPEFTAEEIAEQEKNAAVAEILATYEVAIAEPVECTDNDGNVYHMDGKRDSAAMMRDGIQLAELTGQTTMDITDYYNKTHAGISLENARAIMIQQAASYAAHRAKKCADREAILYPEETAKK